MIPATAQDISDDLDGGASYSLFESVQRKLDDGWRHGNYVREVFKRLADGTFWVVNYQVSGDGEYNTLRDEPENLDCFQVDRTQRMVEIVEYKTL